MKVTRITGLKYNLVRVGMIANIWWVGVKLYKNPITAFNVVKGLVQRFSKLMGRKKLIRGFHSQGKYYWDMYNPGWPSKAFDSFFKMHLIEEQPISTDQIPLRRLIMAITKRCPLNCEHCSEAATLHTKDILTYDQLIGIVDPKVEHGVGQLIYSGGEPLSRFNDLVNMLDRYKDRCDQWIYTSAYGLTAEKARKLKLAGLDGAAVSLDHHDPKAHDLFRRSEKSFEWVVEGIKNLNQEGILVSLNVCPTKEYIESGEVEKIIELAKSLDVQMVNFVEPRAVGNYEGQNVELDEKHKKILLGLTQKYNFDHKYLNYPTVLFPAGYRKNISCGGGRSYLFMDYDGSLYPCPFCKTKMPKVKTQTEVCEAV